MRKKKPIVVSIGVGKVSIHTVMHEGKHAMSIHRLVDQVSPGVPSPPDNRDPQVPEILLVIEDVRGAERLFLPTVLKIMAAAGSQISAMLDNMGYLISEVVVSVRRTALAEMNEKLRKRRGKKGA